MKAVHRVVWIFSGVALQAGAQTAILVALNLEDLNKNIDNIIISLFCQVLRK